MLLKVLFIGDIFGKPGRKSVEKFLPLALAQHPADIVIANCENAAGGKGMSLEIYKELKALGVDGFTGGNHIWDKKNFLTEVDQCPDLVRPINYPKRQPGQGWTLLSKSKVPVVIASAAGRVFMNPANDPFEAVDHALPDMQIKAKIILLDMHAETTSEKAIMAWHFDGRVSAVLGTHTHVQTADERVLPQGTAFISDVGMCGSRDSIIGAERDGAIEGMLSGIKQHPEPAKGPLQFCAAYLTIDTESGKSLSIQRVYLCE